MLESKKEFLAMYLSEQPESAANTIMIHDSDAIPQLANEFKAEVLAKVFNRIPAQILSDGLIHVADTVVADILSKIETTLAARILRKWQIHNHAEKCKNIFSILEPKLSREIQDLVSYSEEVVGAIMNPTPFTVSASLTVETVLDMLKKQKNRYSRYIYVVGPEKELIGVIPFKDVFYCNENLLVSELMSSSVYALNVKTSLHDALKDEAWKNWDSLPVVNFKNKLKGVLKHDILANSSSSIHVKSKNNDDIIKAGNAVGEVLQIGLNATISALGVNKEA
ncbi:MAG: CBS domain-containing protein [Lentisphaeraceae bacterium]|nr:CBS domain-containing protein [Lentisphaeraceae bacterium]